MNKTVRICAVQMSMVENKEKNIKKAISYIKEASQKGANIVLLSELFMGLYFCQKENFDFFDIAIEKNDPIFEEFKKIAKDENIVLPISYFEKCGNCYFNTLKVIDADGTELGEYRKTHIPDGGKYEEKFYFTPGDTGFKVFKTKYGNIGVGICWDQWFLEQARILTLKGADFLYYPTAIGSEEDPNYDSKEHWQHAMIGHSALNIIPVIASNRTGEETIQDSSMTFYGSSFMTDEFGNKVAEMDRTSEGLIMHDYDFDAIKKNRVNWGIFRDRRIEMYKDILNLDLSDKK